MTTMLATETVIPQKNAFISENFLLETPLAQKLFNDYASGMPIIDYHNHLSPADISGNRIFRNMTEIWLNGDHYKWRAMRANGIAEERITGRTSDKEKFMAWAETMPQTLRNPLFHWSQMELLKPFGVEELLTPVNAEKVYAHCNTVLPDYSVQQLLKYYKVDWLCTTDHPLDPLSDHRKMNLEKPGFMRPGFRPDSLLDFSNHAIWNPLRGQLEDATGITISSLDTCIEALLKRVDYFNECGSHIADHGFGNMPVVVARTTELDEAFTQFLNGKLTLTPQQAEQLRGIVLLELCRRYHTLGWVQQFHVGALRNNNTRLRTRLGADAGTDSIHDISQAERMAIFLDRLDREDQLTQTVIYNLNPADNAVFATMAGNFQDGSIPGKIQWGAAWWFLDQKEGMEEQLTVLSNMGLVSRFIGMLTDSRSFLSFSRHEYFRRILCNMLANDIHKGLIPHDLSLTGTLIKNICYENARRYFTAKS